MKQCRKYARRFRRVLEELHQFYCDQGNIKKKLNGAGNVSKENKNKIKIGPKLSNNEKAKIIYHHDMLEAFLLDIGGNCQNQHIKK